MNPHEDEPPVEFDDKLLPVIQTTVSFAIISRAHNIEQLISLLKSLAPLKDEIVLILDNNDETIRNQLADYADIVIPMPGKGCFEAYSADIFYYCTKDWIFRIDDDETLSANCTRELLERYMSKRLINAWWIPRKWFVDKTHYICSGQWFPDYQLRLFRNIPGILALPGRIHEALRVLGRNEHLDEIRLEHWDLLTPREMREKKTAHYNELLPNNGCTSFYLYEDEIYTCMACPPPPRRFLKIVALPLFRKKYEKICATARK
ncbi:MAG: hypothetical protein LBD58_05715 [Treponema sp.]|jgi:hypothetical protein|nr:hypothetical protein [Treponema sp.]